MVPVKNGFTLIELMVTLAVAVILMAIGVPGMQSLMEGSRVRAATNSMLSDLLYARAQAVNLGLQVTLCPLNVSSTCVDDWNLGMSMFVDANSNQKLDAGELKIKIASPFASSDTVKFNNGSWLSFTPDGITNKNGTFSYCTSTHSPMAVTLSQSGRARVNNESASCS